MSRTKYYCLRCERPNNCKCSDDTKRFTISYKLRPPLTTKNKARFRKFLDDVQIFGNMVHYKDQHLTSDFIALLRKVKHNGILNGVNWYAIQEKK